MYNCEIFPGCEDEYDDNERFYISNLDKFKDDLPEMSSFTLANSRYVLEYFHKMFKDNGDKIANYFEKNIEKYKFEDIIQKCVFVLSDDDKKTKFTKEKKILLTYSLLVLIVEGLLNNLFYDFKRFSKIFPSFNALITTLGSHEYYVTQESEFVKNNTMSYNKKPIYVESFINDFGTDVHCIYLGDEEFIKFIKKFSFVNIAPMKYRFDKNIYFGVKDANDIYFEDFDEIVKAENIEILKKHFGDNYESFKNKNYEFVEIVLDYPHSNHTVLIRPIKCFYTNIYDNILYMKNKKSKYSFIDINEVNELFLPIYGGPIKGTFVSNMTNFDKSKYGLETFVSLLDERVAKTIDSNKYHINYSTAVFKRVYNDKNGTPVIVRFDSLNSLSEIKVKEIELEDVRDQEEYIMYNIYNKNRKIIDYLNRY